MVILAAALAVASCPGLALAARAISPAEATVFIRVVGEIRVEFVDAWKQSVEEKEVEFGTGSGFIISPYGHVLTNYHVVSGGEISKNVQGRDVKIFLKVGRVEVALPASGDPAVEPQRLVASVDAVDPALDLAVLSVTGVDLPYIAFGDSDAAESGEPVQVLGFPFGGQLEVGQTTIPDIVPQVSVGRGSLSAKRAGEDGRTRYLQASATLNPGNSGGPLLDRDGFALGVVRMKLMDAEGVGFAIPINVVKDFLETRGLDQLLPVRRLRLGPPENLERKGLRLCFPEGQEDMSPRRLRVDGGGSGEDLALKVDRVASPWTVEEIEQALLSGEVWESFTVDPRSVSTVRVAEGRGLAGRARGASPKGEADLLMEFAILDLGKEKLVARFVGPEEQVAFNLSVLRESLRSLDARALLIDEIDSPQEATWAEAAFASSGAPRLVVPAGWVIEEGAPLPCPGLAPPDAATLLSPLGDFTVSFLAAWRQGVSDAAGAASTCSSRQGSLGPASYLSQIDYLGVSYGIEGVFVRHGNGLLQLEWVAPIEKRDFVLGLFRTWVERNRRSGPSAAR